MLYITVERWRAYFLLSRYRRMRRLAYHRKHRWRISTLLYLSTYNLLLKLTKDSQTEAGRLNMIIAILQIQSSLEHLRAPDRILSIADMMSSHFLVHLS